MNTNILSVTHAASHGRRAPGLAARIREWHRRARERRQLLELDARALCDVGLTPEQAAHEGRKPFWQR